jgi:hypothetical protein
MSVGVFVENSLEAENLDFWFHPSGFIGHGPSDLSVAAVLSGFNTG